MSFADTERVTEAATRRDKEESLKPKTIYIRPPFLSSLSSQSTKQSEGISNFEKNEQSSPVLSNLDQDIKLLDTAQEKPIKLLNEYDKLTELLTQKSITAIANPDGYPNYKPYSQENLPPSTQGFQILSKLNIVERTPQPQFKHILPIIKQQTDKKLAIDLPEISFNVTDSKPIVNFNKSLLNLKLFLIVS